MGFDGLTLSKFFNPDLPLSPDVYEAFIAEFAPIIKNFQNKTEEMGLGKTFKINAEIGDVCIQFKIMDENNFIGIVSHKNALQGKIDYYANLEVNKFQQAFDV
jgi:hypothetical protein